MTQPDEALLADLRQHAPALDRGTESTRRSFPALGQAGILGLGAPGNADGRLPEMASAISAIAGACMSTAFSLWSTRMVIEYLLTSGTPYAAGAAERLRAGTVLGVTGMASAFKEAAGCGSIDLIAAPEGDGCELSGQIHWASNLHEDSLLVTAARTPEGERLIVALPLRTPGVAAAEPRPLLALDSTASSSLTLDGARITGEQVLSRDFGPYLDWVRPVFLILQSAMCLGLATESLAQASTSLTGVNAVFADGAGRLEADLTAARDRLKTLAAAVGGPAAPAKKDLLELRLAAAELSVQCTALESRTAGGRGYASEAPASRRYREAAFIPVQSPSEAQLRWELARCEQA